MIYRDEYLPNKYSMYADGSRAIEDLSPSLISLVSRSAEGQVCEGIGGGGGSSLWFGNPPY